MVKYNIKENKNDYTWTAKVALLTGIAAVGAEIDNKKFKTKSYFSNWRLKILFTSVFKLNSNTTLPRRTSSSTSLSTKYLPDDLHKFLAL